MIHAREEYNRIQDPAGLIGSDEPVFLLRAKDKHAPQTIREWAKLQKADGNTDKCVEVAFVWADKMDRWQAENGSKLADSVSNTTTPPDYKQNTAIFGGIPKQNTPVFGCGRFANIINHIGYGSIGWVIGDIILAFLK